MTLCETRWIASFFMAISLALAWGCAQTQAPTEQEVLSSDEPLPEDSISEVELQNLQAFARLYGYIRFFHPSDEVAELDWDRFAIYGAGRVKDARDSRALREELEALFLPMAPTIQIDPEEVASSPDPEIAQESKEGLKLVAWQHQGVGLGFTDPSYISHRLNRQTVFGEERSPGILVQNLDATPFRGMEFRFYGTARAEVLDESSRLQLMARVDGRDGEMRFLDAMSDRPITTTGEWERFEIRGIIADDAERLVIGGIFHGFGGAYLDRFELWTREGNEGEWAPVNIDNSAFEEGEIGEVPPDWLRGVSGYRYQIILFEDDAGEPRRAALIESIASSPTVIDEPIFDAQPEPGQRLQRDLGRGLSVEFPLALYSHDGQTLGDVDEEALQTLISNLQNLATSEFDSEAANLRFALVIITWNIFQHFYPYFDVIDKDWNDVLPEALDRARGDAGAHDFLATLRWMVAQLEDGHGDVFHPILNQRSQLPFLVDDVEEEIVIVASSHEEIKVGDVIISIDGVAAVEDLLRQEELISGSPQWKRHQASKQLTLRTINVPVSLEITRNEELVTLEVLPEFDGAPGETRPENIELIEDGIYYVNLDQASMAEIEEVIDSLADAEGIIFDLRGMPNQNHLILGHLTDTPIQTAHFRRPQIIFPDRMDWDFVMDGRWSIQPREPRIRGEVVFLIDSRVISYGETVTGIVEHYGLGTLIGQPTSGANGNMNRVYLPGGYRVDFTGMLVLKHDESQHHLVGTIPDITMGRTLEGIRQGRDEFLDRGLEWITDSIR